MKYRNAISPVVATALFLVVAVISIVGFQSWYQSFQSKQLVDVRNQGDVSSFGSRIETVTKDGIYFFHAGNFDGSYSQIRIGNITCNAGGILKHGTNKLSLLNCNGNISSGAFDVMIVSDLGVLTKKLVLKESVFPLVCPEGYVAVPGNSDLGTSDFCVMKYEAKEDSSGACATGFTNNCPISQASGEPWVSISQTNARIECESLGDGYGLITDRQWVTIARNLESNPSNWFGGQVGVNFMFSGHNDDEQNSENILEASNNDEDGYFGTADSESSCDGVYAGSGYVLADDTTFGMACAGQRRTLELTTGDILWDFSGNVWDWTNDTFNSNSQSSLGKEDSMLYEWTEISDYDYLKSINLNFNSTHGIGKVYADPDNAVPSGTVHALRRGGRFGSGTFGGVFALDLRYSPSRTDKGFGFRCSYSP